MGTENEIRTQRRARLQLLLAITTFGTIGVLARLIDLRAAEIALYRAAIAFLVLSLYLLISGRFGKALHLSRRLLLRLFVSGLLMGINWVLIFTAYRYTSVALATLSYYFAPTLVVLGSMLLLKERPGKWQLLCFAGSTAGLMMMLGTDGSGSTDAIGILYGLGAAVLYAAVILLNRVSGEVDGLMRTWLQFGAAALVLLPYVALSGGFELQTLKSTGLLSLLLLGVFHTGFMYVLYFGTLPHLSGREVAMLSYLDPLVSVFLSFLVLHEQIGWQQLLGGATLLAFTVIGELALPKKPTEEIKTLR